MMMQCFFQHRVIFWYQRSFRKFTQCRPDEQSEISDHRSEFDEPKMPLFSNGAGHYHHEYINPVTKENDYASNP